MKATQVKPQEYPTVPKQCTVCANCGNPCTYVYGYVNNGKGAVCSRSCDERYQKRSKNHVQSSGMSEV